MKSILIVLLVLLCLTPVFAQTAIKAEIDKAKISTDDNLTYKLTITSSDKNIPQPVFPKFAGFYILSQAQSSSVSFSREGAKTVLVYAFILAPKNAGKLKIEPSQIKLNAKTISTQEFEIEVTQGTGKPRVPPKQTPIPPEENPPESEEQPQYVL